MAKITPLLIVLALIFSITAINLLDGSIHFWYVGLLYLALCIILWIGDQFFRFFIKSLTKLWIIEILFILIVVLFLWILGLW